MGLDRVWRRYYDGMATKIQRVWRGVYGRWSVQNLRAWTVMNDAYNMQQSKNSEILHRFCMLAVAAGDKEIIPTVIRFITTQGRMKFVRPLYRALYKSEMGKEIAVKTFLANREFYHPIAAKMVATDMSVGKANEDDDGKSKKKSVSLAVVGAVVVLAAAVGIALRRGKR